MAKANENDKKITKYLLIGLGVVVFLAMVGSSSDKSKTTETKPEESVKEVVATPTPKPVEAPTPTPEPIESKEDKEKREELEKERQYLSDITAINQELLSATKKFSKLFSDQESAMNIFIVGSDEYLDLQKALSELRVVHQKTKALQAPKAFESVHSTYLEATKIYYDMTYVLDEAVDEKDINKFEKAASMVIKAGNKIGESTSLLESVKKQKGY